jgi:large subunit ribosomal protein L30
MIKVTLIKSACNATKSVKATIAALGLKKIRSFRIHDENPCILGMIAKVKYLVKVEKI